MLTVELDELSGLPNPRWDIPSEEVNAFLAAVSNDVSQVREVHDSVDVLGFRGYVVHSDGIGARALAAVGLPAEFRIHDRGDSPRDRKAAQALLEQDRALGRAPGRFEPVLNEHTSPAAESPQVAAMMAAACSLNYTSWNDLSFWNATRKDQNNCYNYAGNFASKSPGGRALPGRQSGNSLAGIGDDDMRRALRSDGWKLECTGSSLRIFAVSGFSSSGFWDFHFYRKNLNGSTSRWCHKRGLTRAKNTDESGNYIGNPANANRAFYENVIGTFFSPAETRKVVVR